jgi:hypothetical protein
MALCLDLLLADLLRDLGLVGASGLVDVCLAVA